METCGYDKAQVRRYDDLGGLAVSVVALNAIVLEDVSKRGGGAVWLELGVETVANV